MRRLFFSVVFLLVLLAFPAFAQTRPGGGSNGGGRSPNVGHPTLPPRDVAPMPTTAFLSGRVMLDDGTELTEPAAIQMTCRGEHHTRAYSDRHGEFSFQFGDPSSTAIGDMADASSGTMSRSSMARDQRHWQDCQLQAVLAGFTSDVIELASRMNSLESTNVGKLVLHRLAQVEGTSISVSSAAAPNSARKALEKGRDEEQKGKLDQAQASLEKAVQIYPKYATAWFELGQVQMLKKDPAAAKRSFEQSVAADPKYVNPYNRLAEIAFEARQWPQVIESTNKLLTLNPLSFPFAYFFNGVANYQLQDFDAAEKSTRQGIRVDDQHQIPKLQYLLGMICLQKHDYPHASEAMQQYLQFARQPAEIEQAKKQLAEIARMSGTNAADADGKK